MTHSRIRFPLLALLAATLLAPLRADDAALTVRFRSEAWFFTHERLMELSEPTFMNLRGTHKKPAIDFTELLFGQTGVDRDDVELILIFRHSGSPVILRGQALQHLDGLVVTGGDDKLSGEPHVWALAPRDDAAYEALKKELGSLRKRDMYRIDIHPITRSIE